MRDLEKDVKDKHFGTKAVHAGVRQDAATGAIMTPIIQSTTYVQQELGQEYDYARTSHPTREALETSIRTLEDSSYAYTFSSGMSAADSVYKLLRPGDEVVAALDLYGGIYRLAEHMYLPMGIKTYFVSMQNIDKIEEYLSSATRLVWLESPSNPTLEITDIEEVSNLARKYGAWTVVDNTFATPCLQKPLELGADIVLHSVTKYINGHSDVLMGAICCSDSTLAEHFSTCQRNVGAVPAPIDCFLVQRGIKTLSLRMKSHCENAFAVAEYLEDHKSVEEVLFPGLSTHSGHKIAKKQMKEGFGGMLSFRLKNVGEKETLALMKKLYIFSMAESLGGVESLACYPIKMTHASIPKEDQIKRGITENLIRLSIGIEDKNDLIDDLEQAISYTLKK